MSAACDHDQARYDANRIACELDQNRVLSARRTAVDVDDAEKSNKA